MTRRAGLYVRLSTVKVTEQATDDAAERQEDRGRAFCTAKGWDVAKVYDTDVDVSAYRAPGQKAPPRRQGFEQALADIAAGSIDALVCFKLDRLVRDHGDFERVLAVCERHGAVLASVTESFDTSTPHGEMAARMTVSFGRLESQTIGLRVAAQREQAAGRGLPAPGGWPTFGYRYIPKTDQAPARYEIIPEQAELIREAARRVLAGKSLNSIARDFDRRGVVTAAPHRKPERQAKAFYTRRLKRILVNPAIAGIRAYRGKELRAATWDPILDRPTWERVRAVLLAPERQRGGHPREWPMASLAVCGCPGCTPPKRPERAHHGECGAPLRSKWTRSVPVLACDPTKPGFKGCGKVSINQRHLEQIVLKMIGKRDWRRLAGALRELAARDAADPGLAEQLAADEAELRSLAQRRALRKLEEGEWLAMREVLLDRIAAAKAQLERRVTVPPEALDPSQPITETWDRWTVEQQRTVLRAIFRQIVVLPATRRGRGPDPDRVVPDWRA